MQPIFSSTHSLPCSFLRRISPWRTQRKKWNLRAIKNRLLNGWPSRGTPLLKWTLRSRDQRKSYIQQRRNVNVIPNLSSGLWARLVGLAFSNVSDFFLCTHFVDHFRDPFKAYCSKARQVIVCHERLNGQVALQARFLLVWHSIVAQQIK